MADEFTQQVVSSLETPSSPKPKKWPIFLNITVIIVLIGTIGFLAYQNYQLKKAPEMPPPILPLIFPPRVEEEIKIIDGSIYRIYSSGKAELLVDKDDSQFKTNYIQGFTDVKISSDKAKICFTGWPPAPAPMLYYTNLINNETIQIGGGKNCFWSPDSQKIAYINYATDISPIDIFVYDTLSRETKNLTENAAQGGHIRYYKSPTWIDKIKLFGDFVSVEMPEGTTKTEGISTVNVLTGEITDQVNFRCESTISD